MSLNCASYSDICRPNSHTNTDKQYLRMQNSIWSHRRLLKSFI